MVTRAVEFWKKALEVVGQMPASDRLPAFALVIIAFLTLSVFTWRAFKSKKQLSEKILALIFLCLTAIVLFALGASTFRATRGIYHIRFVVLGIDGQPMDDVRVTASVSGGLKKANDNWEFDVPPQTKPSDGKIIIYARADDSSLIGSSTIALKDDFYPPTVTIQLRTQRSAMACGNVMDERGQPVVGARVSVLGEPDSTTTNEAGYFALAAHQIAGEPITIRVEHAGRITEQTIIAGQGAEVIVRKRRM